MKTLKFATPLVTPILSGQKTATWRLFDDKDLCENDRLLLVEKESGQTFATATITSIREKKLGNIQEIDYDGHERFRNTKELFDTYRGYYGEKVTPDTVVKIITFQLNKNRPQKI